MPTALCRYRWSIDAVLPTRAAMLAAACGWAGATTALAAPLCVAPVLVNQVQVHGNGDAISLDWNAEHAASRFRIWAQWRVPEGEVLRTHEVVAEAKQTQLPPSPARWRPLKLSIELQSLCRDGSVSKVTSLRQLQFDPVAEKTCRPVEGVVLDRERMRLSWKDETRDFLVLSFYNAENGQLLAQHEAVGSSAPWPTLVGRPIVIRAVRACGETQRSRATFLLVQ